MGKLTRNVSLKNILQDIYIFILQDNIITGYEKTFHCTLHHFIYWENRSYTPNVPILLTRMTVIFLVSIIKKIKQVKVRIAVRCYQ